MSLYAVKTHKVSRVISLGDCPWNEHGKDGLVINTADSTARCVHCGRTGSVEATLEGYALVKQNPQKWTLESPNKPLG
jgi:hypothetical protein